MKLKVPITSKQKSFFLFIVVPFLIIFSNLQQRPLNHEGGQSHLWELNEKLDWWGSVLPIITPNQNFNKSSLLISIFSLFIFIIGLRLIIKYSDLLEKNSIILFILCYCGYNFVIANSRDSFLLSFAILNFGLVNLIIKTKKYQILFILLIGLMLMISFKYVTGLSILLLLIYYFVRKLEKLTVIKYVIIFLATFIITFLGIFLDKNLSSFANLKHSYPEQAPIYQDLAAFYCWSDDPTTRSRALQVIKPILLTQNTSDICLSFRPNSWGYLVTGGNFSSYGTPAPFKKITYKESDLVEPLIQGWLKTILKDPVDYVQFKLISATQIISVGHPFKYPLDMSNFTNESDQLVQVSKIVPNFIANLSDRLWKSNRFILNLIGSTYIFSIAFLFILIFFIVLKRNNVNFSNEFLLFIFFSNILNLTLLSIAFVSDEARYVFPMVFITYLIMLINLDFGKRTIQGH
jgi:hypothetical protein